MSDRTIRVVARVVALPDKIEQVKSILKALVKPTRAEKGCLQYDLLQNKKDPTDFTFVEEWETEAALEAHLESKQIELADRELDGLVASEPDIRLYDRIM